MLAIEHQFDRQSFDDQSTETGQWDHPLLVSEPLNDSKSNQLVESLAQQSNDAFSQTSYASGPIRAGPQLNATALECGGDCHLSLVLRQVAVDTIAVEVELIQSETGNTIAFVTPVLANADISTLGSRGPPSLA